MDEVMREGEETTCTKEGCECQAPQQEVTIEDRNEEISFAFLLALMPLVALSFFGQAGLI